MSSNVPEPKVDVPYTPRQAMEMMSMYPYKAFKMGTRYMLGRGEWYRFFHPFLDPEFSIREESGAEGTLSSLWFHKTPENRITYITAEVMEKIIDAFDTPFYLVGSTQFPV